MRRLLLLCLLVTSTASAQEIYRTGLGIFMGQKDFNLRGAYSDEYDFVRNIWPSKNRNYQYLGLNARFNVGKKNLFRTSFSVYDDLAPRNFELVYARKLFSHFSVLAGFHQFDLLYSKDYYLDYEHTFPGFRPYPIPDLNSGNYFSTREYFTGPGYQYSARHWEVNTEVHLGLSELNALLPESQYYARQEEIFKVDLTLKKRLQLLTALRISAGFYPFSKGRLGLQAHYRISGNAIGASSFQRTIYHWTAETRTGRPYIYLRNGCLSRIWISGFIIVFNLPPLQVVHGLPYQHFLPGFPEAGFFIQSPGGGVSFFYQQSQGEPLFFPVFRNQVAKQFSAHSPPLPFRVNADGINIEFAGIGFIFRLKGFTGKGVNILYHGFSQFFQQGTVIGVHRSHNSAFMTGYVYIPAGILAVFRAHQVKHEVNSCLFVPGSQEFKDDILHGQ